MTLPTGATVSYQFVTGPSVQHRLSKPVGSVSTDPFGGPVETTSYSYQFDVASGNVAKTTVTRADGSKHITDFNTAGNYPWLRQKESWTDTDGFTVLREAETVWASMDLGAQVSTVVVRQPGTNWEGRAERTTDRWGREVARKLYDRQVTHTYSGELYSYKLNSAVYRQYADINSTTFRGPLLREDLVSADGSGQEYVVSTTEFVYDNLLERRRSRRYIWCSARKIPREGAVTMALTGTSLPVRSFGETSRRDRWWLQPLAVFLGLGAFVVYSTWAAFQGEHYHYGPYLSPFYSPEIFGESAHSWLGPKPGWWPLWLPWSPAFLILWAPGGFRLTCYYYRGAYYKAFWADPPSCTVGEPRKSYRGERSFPLILQNVHRYFLYLALLFLVFLSWDVWKALWFEGALGLGVGTLVLAGNVFLLGGYTFSCHSLRHLVGGRLDQFRDVPLRRTGYRCVSCLNRRHMVWAWTSLVWVAFSDLYVRMCSMGVWADWRIF